MSGTSVVQERRSLSGTVTTETIVKALDHLSPECLSDVLQFIQFLEFKTQAALDEHSEDEALWDAVQANQAYKAQHPDEELERYKSGSEFLKAVAEL